MEFNEKLKTLRKQKDLTQEDLAKRLFVSRTAVSKWESGRGYPSIDMLKHIAEEFSLSVDELLSGKELLLAAEQDNKKIKSGLFDMVFGLLDVCTAVVLFLPLTAVSEWLKITYFCLVAVMVLLGVITLALQSITFLFFEKIKSKLSVCVNISAALIFILSRQPYAAAILFMFLIIKACLLKGRH